jgi:hypothetical protein
VFCLLWMKCDKAKGADLGGFASSSISAPPSCVLFPSFAALTRYSSPADRHGI